MKNNVNVSRKSKLKYVDDSMLEAQFSFLVIRVKSIVEKFGSIEEFAVGNDISGVTNGKLIVIYDMSEPPPFLYKLEEEVLEPAGLKEFDDYVIAFEQYLMIADSLPDSKELPRGKSNLNEPIPICDQVPWLGSVISDIGNFVWDKSEQVCQNDPNLIRIATSEGIVEGVITVREKYRLRIKMTSPFIGWESESTCWPPRTAPDNTFLSSRGEKVSREMLEESYDLVKKMDDSIDEVVSSYDDLLEELSETSKLIPSDARNRIERKIRSYFFSHNFMDIRSRYEDQVEEIIRTYKNSGRKTYLKEDGVKSA